MNQRINTLQTNQRRAADNGRQQAQRRPATSGSSTQNTSRTVGTASNYGIARNASALHVGDVLRGEITDLRNNQITITLEDNTIVRAQIPDSSSYSIGQFGSFRLTEISGGTIYLENITAGYSDTELTLINKALDKANLPATVHNQETVKALMDNLLPINRESIQELMQQAYDFNTADMNTLAVMKRLMMKMDTDSVAQFSNYRNGNHHLLDRLQNFSQEIPSLLSALADNGPADAVSYFGKSLLSIGLSPTAAAPQATIANLSAEMQEGLAKLLNNAPLTEDTITQLNNRTLSLQDALTLIRDSALEGTLTLPAENTPSTIAEQINQINQLLEPAADLPVITEDFVKNVISINPDSEPEILEETESAPTEMTEFSAEEAPPAEAKPEGRFTFAGKFLQSLSENAKLLTENLNNALRNSPEETVTAKQNQTIDTLIHVYEKFARDNDLLSSYLTSDERNELIDHLQNFPVSRNMLLKISSGEAATKDVLTVIHNTLSMTDSQTVQKLFQSTSFEKLFARNLQSNWTLSPNQLANNDVSDFYDTMHRQMQQYHNLIESTLSGTDSKEMSGLAHDIESNISFMKTLNETFSYFQLPLKLPSQDTHGDFYVYSRKERLRQNPEKASVLLHLELENLGQIDIKLDKNKSDIAATFSLNDKASTDLFKVNADMLKNALNAQGYSCSMQILEKEQPSPTVDDFINTKVNTHATTEMKRFSFDIRA